VGTALLGLLLEEEGGSIWDLWAPLCRANIVRLWWRPVAVLRQRYHRGRPVCGFSVASLSPEVEGLREN
jgi:hypothetical protein